MSGDTIEDFMARHADSTDAIADSTANALDQIFEFNNAREEMFFGFSSNRLTGDLIRQVKQQGVETLITKTEVVMTNQFNGMTTTEAAKQILDEIELGATLRGFSLSRN
jgi:hypothetical protein